MCESGQVEILEHFRGEIIKQKTILGSSLMRARASALQPTCVMRCRSSSLTLTNSKQRRKLCNRLDALYNKEAVEENEMETRHASIKHSHRNTNAISHHWMAGIGSGSPPLLFSQSAAFYYFITPLAEESESIKAPVFLFGCG